MIEDGLPERFLATILAADRHRATDVVRAALADGADVRILYTEVLQDALWEVGRRWQVNELTVAEEHAATATVQYVLSAIYAELPRAGEAAGRAVVAGVPGEHHQVGLHMAADVLELGGWSTLFLGSDVPQSALLRAVESHEATLVGLGATMAHNLPALEELVAQVVAGFASTRILIGGQAAALVDPTEIGADACVPDVRVICDLARGTGPGRDVPVA